MKAVREVGFQGPVANLSFPDVTNAVLGRLGLAPTIGLGNAAIIYLRVRAALRRSVEQAGKSLDDLPLVRLIAHHHQVYGSMLSRTPDRPEDRCRVFLGQEGERADELAYQGHPVEIGVEYNVITAAAALPVLLAFLPGADPLRISTPAPMGLPGGYPVAIKDGRVELDLPRQVDLEEVKAFHWRLARQDGVESVSAEGVITFSSKAKKAVADLDPALAEPLPIEECRPRFQLLMSHLEV
jgi:hypothetical protein